MSESNNLINGTWVPGTGALLHVISPATGRLIWTGTAASSAEIARACHAARTAFGPWAGLALDKRIAVCLRFRDVLEAHSETLAETISSEVGKPLWEARTEVASMAAKVGISIASQAARAGEWTTSVTDGACTVRHRPHGVMAVFGPYNFPGHLPNGHILPALLAGNTVVFKPSEHAPQTAIATVRLWLEAGLPAGVLNLVHGAGDSGAVLAQQVQLDGILFTGSYRVGALLHRAFAGQPGKMLALEMGGNNAVVAWRSQHLDAGVHHAIFSAFVSAGQRCTCARRLIVEDSQYGEAFVNRLVNVAGRLCVGPGDQSPAPFMGPVVSVAAAQRLLAVQADLVARGGVCMLEMRQLVEDTGLLSAGIVDMTGVRDVPDEEFFGPLLQVTRVANFAAATEAVNATSYGLAAGLLCDDPSLWDQFRDAVRAGVVNWNRPTTGAASAAPFGGVGRSGNHRPSAYYAADYCAFPVASLESTLSAMPAQLSPGLVFDIDQKARR
ncbi:MAG: succinylglutamate-semialdehyde dehydrogenase [Burkholderiaceae bacterium]